MNATTFWHMNNRDLHTIRQNAAGSQIQPTPLST